MDSAEPADPAGPTDPASPADPAGTAGPAGAAGPVDPAGTAGTAGTGTAGTGTAGAGGRAVEEHARGRVVSDAPVSRPVPVALRFDPGFSPATVRFVFPGEVEWSFPRALLEAGLRTPTRRGDIEVWPCGRVQTVVEFHGADQVAVVQFDTPALLRFLRRTYASGKGADPGARAATGTGARAAAGTAAKAPVAAATAGTAATAPAPGAVAPGADARTPSARR